MAETGTLRRRIGDDDSNEINPTTETDDELTDDDDDYEEYYEDDQVDELSIWRERILRWKTAIAKNGILSLAIAITPALLHIADVWFLRSPERAAARPSWHRSMDAEFAASSLFISLISYLAWAEHGVYDDPKEFAFWFVVYNALSLAWNPIVLGWGAVKIGLVVWAVRTLSAFAIGCSIRLVNHRAGDLIVHGIGTLLGLKLLRTNLELLDW